MKSGCELCRAEKKTEWLFEDSLCWVAPCIACQPDLIVVLKQHTAEPDSLTREHLADVGISVARREFGHGNWKFDFQRRSIPDHYHFHLRRK